MRWLKFSKWRVYKQIEQQVPSQNDNDDTSQSKLMYMVKVYLTEGRR